MKKLLFLTLILCLLLAGCAVTDGHGGSDQDQVEEPAVPDTGDDRGTEIPEVTPLLLDRLTVELVADATDADRIMGILQQLPADLDEALKAVSIDVETIRCTMSTASGISGDALISGGVDMAFLPFEDYASRANDLTPLLMSGDEEELWILALSRANVSLRSTDVQLLLRKALLETDGGQKFLAAYAPERSYEPVDQPYLEALTEE